MFILPQENQKFKYNYFIFDLKINDKTMPVVIAAVISMGVTLLIYFMNQIISLIGVTWIKEILEKIDFVNYYSNFTYGLLNVCGPCLPAHHQ